jgi:hypothetical protein
VALPRRQQREGEKGATVGRGGFYNGTTGWGTGRGLHHAAMRGGEGRGASAAVGRHGVAGSGPPATLVGGTRARGNKTGEGGG